MPQHQRASQVIKSRVMNAAEELGGTYTVSRKGVPHIMCCLDGDDVWASVCWFGKYHFWRVFYPCHANGQHYIDRALERKDCKTLDDVELALVALQDLCDPYINDNNNWLINGGREGE